MARRLPPLLALEAFDSAARHMSFKAAAAELGLTPSAISHRVKQLEHHLGQPLFRRLNREIRLTAAGHDYFSAVRRGLDQVAQATQRAGAGGQGEELRLSCIPHFASSWIIPHLEEFLDAQPGLRLFVESSQRHADFARDPVDAAIRYGHGRWPGLAAVKLTDIAVVPVCAPSLLPALRQPRDLRGQTLIHLSGFPEAWPRWLAEADVDGLTPRREIWVNTISQMLEAAERGLGVGLGLVPLFSPQLADGSLAIPFAPIVPQPHGYWFVCRRADAAKPRIAALRTWLQSLMRQANADMARLGKPAQRRRRSPARG